MKVAFVFGGLPHYFNKVLNKINAHHEVYVISPSSLSKTIGNGVHQTEEGIEFKNIKLTEYNTYYKKPFFKHFYKTINQIKPDAIVIGWPYYLAFAFYPLLLLKLKLLGVKIYSKEIPFTIPNYNTSLADFKNECVESQMQEPMFKSKWIYFNIKLIRKYLYSLVLNKAFVYLEKGIEIFESYGMKKENIVVTYNSPDNEDIFKTINTLKAKGINTAKISFRLLHVGRLVKWKQVDLLINAVAKLKAEFSDIQLTIIGNGEELESLKKLTASLDLQNHVTFLGSIYKEENLSIEFLKSSIYVLAGMGGLSINEAMCHSLPVICSVADGTEKHLVFEGYNGFYFKDGDLDSLIISIKKAFNSDIQKMGENSLKIITEKINIKTVSNIYINGF